MQQIDIALNKKIVHLQSLSNVELLRLYNGKPDFKNDDEMHEICRRVDLGTLKVKRNFYDKLIEDFD